MNTTLAHWQQFGDTEPHEHEWAPTFRVGPITGEPHRPCTVVGCPAITLDSEECDCGDYDHCDDCGAYRDEIVEWATEAGIDPRKFL